jgi:hypothetical protein
MDKAWVDAFALAGVENQPIDISISRRRNVSGNWSNGWYRLSDCLRREDAAEQNTSEVGEEKK